MYVYSLVQVIKHISTALHEYELTSKCGHQTTFILLQALVDVKSVNIVLTKLT